MAHHVQDMSDLNERLAEAGNRLVILDFYATWCGPCKVISPKIEEMSKEFVDVVFLKVDVDECEDIATKYDIQSMPTFVFIKNNETLESFSGANADKLRTVLLRHR